MIKGRLYFERERDQSVIPEAYIIEKLNESVCEIYEQPKLRLPENYPETTAPRSKESSHVIIIEL